ncbi:hypothetical protein [Mangrovibacterium sp.]
MEWKEGEFVQLKLVALNSQKVKIRYRNNVLELDLVGGNVLCVM